MNLRPDEITSIIKERAARAARAAWAAWAARAARAASGMQLV